MNPDNLHEKLKVLRYCTVRFRLSKDDEWRSGRLMTFHINNLVDDKGVVASIQGDDDEVYRIPMHRADDLLKFTAVESEVVREGIEEYEETDWDEKRNHFSRWDHRPDLETDEDDEPVDDDPMDLTPDDDFDVSEFLRENTDYDPDVDDEPEDDESEEEVNPVEQLPDEVEQFEEDWPLFIVKLTTGKWLALNAAGEPLTDEPLAKRKKIKEEFPIQRIRKIIDDVWITMPGSEENLPFTVGGLRDQFDIEEDE